MGLDNFWVKVPEPVKLVTVAAGVLGASLGLAKLSRLDGEANPMNTTRESVATVMADAGTVDVGVEEKPNLTLNYQVGSENLDGGKK